MIRLMPSLVMGKANLNETILMCGAVHWGIMHQDSDLAIFFMSLPIFLLSYSLTMGNAKLINLLWDVAPF